MMQRNGKKIRENINYERYLTREQIRSVIVLIVAHGSLVVSQFEPPNKIAFFMPARVMHGVNSS